MNDNVSLRTLDIKVGRDVSVKIGAQTSRGSSKFRRLLLHVQRRQLRS